MRVDRRGYLGDALEIMPALRLEGQAFAFTDPPYNVGMIYGPNVNDRVADEVFLAWSALWIALLRNIAPTMAIYTPAKHLPKFWRMLGDEDFRQIVLNWTPSGPVRRGFCSQHATILTNYAPDGRKNNLPDVWTNPPSRRMGYAFHEVDYGHPGATSEGITRKVLGHLAGEADVIVDPFAGTGTTLAVAKERGQRAIGNEKAEAWAEVAAKGLEMTTPAMI